MKPSILFSVGFLPLSFALTGREDHQISKRETAQQATDRLLFSTSISSFIAARNAKNPPELDWTSDGCSSSPDNPFGYDFLDSCTRHDFGYRNYKSQGRYNDATKLRIDDNFHTDMNNRCNSYATASICRALATVYYEAVRAFGKKDPAEISKLVAAAEK